jgi:hypothetical protein
MPTFIRLFNSAVIYLNHLVKQIIKGGGGTQTDRKLNILVRYDIAQYDRILHRLVQHLCQHNLKI